MKIKKLIPITSDYAVLATQKYHFFGTCSDLQGDGHSFFWAVVEDGYEDRIELIDVDVDRNQRICSRRLVVPRKPCPICNHQMEPRYNNQHQPNFWQECLSCGYAFDMRGYEMEEEDECSQGCD